MGFWPGAIGQQEQLTSAVSHLGARMAGCDLHAS